MKRFRDYGLQSGLLPAGTRNTIADVPGVVVGHCSKIAGDAVRTGVTIIDPGVQDLYHTKLSAAVAVGNGYGKMTGIAQINELGTLETPIALTNTLAVGPVMRGLVDLVLATTPAMEPTDTINAVVGETNDGLLNDIQQDVLTKADVRAAYDARSADVQVGCVGAGTGTRAFSWKGGIGSSSRRITVQGTTYTVGVLVQTNFGGALTINGVPVGERLGKTDFSSILRTGDGSCMIVVATDAPVDARQLGRIARRTFLGLARTGSVLASGSGDFAVAFSTSKNVGIADADLTPFFLATVEATEESVYDALFAATTTSGRSGSVLEALPKDTVVPWLVRNTI